MNLHEGDVGGRFISPGVGPRIPERLTEAQTKSNLPVLRVMRLGCGLNPIKNHDHGNLDVNNRNFAWYGHSDLLNS